MTRGLKKSLKDSNTKEEKSGDSGICVSRNRENSRHFFIRDELTGFENRSITT